MPVTVQCPHCHAVFQVSSRFVDTKGKCRVCNDVFSVSAENAEATEQKLKNGDAVLTDLPCPPNADDQPADAKIPLALPFAQIDTSAVEGDIPVARAVLANGETEYPTDSKVDRRDEEIIAEIVTSDQATNVDDRPPQEIEKKEPAISTPYLVLVGGGLLIVAISISYGIGQWIQAGISAPNPLLAADNGSTAEKGSLHVNGDAARKDRGFRAHSSSENLIASNSRENLRQSDEALNHFSTDEAFRAWRSVGNYLVEIEVTSGSYRRRLTGIIVDSRGWVLTSLRAVSGAESITARQSNRLIADGEPVLEKTFSAQGVIALDESHDLVLLTFDKMLLRGINSLEIHDDIDLVDGQRCFECRLPRADRRFWIRDTRILDRSFVSRLSKPMRTQVADLQLDLKPTESLLVIDRPFEESQVGAALFDKHHRLGGIVISGTDGATETVAIPTDSIAALLKHASVANLMTVAQALRSRPLHRVKTAPAEVAPITTDPPEQ